LGFLDVEILFEEIDSFWFFGFYSEKIFEILFEQFVLFLAYEDWEVFLIAELLSRSCFWFKCFF
jgi:hypothetical protein